MTRLAWLGLALALGLMAGATAAQTREPGKGLTEEERKQLQEQAAKRNAQAVQAYQRGRYKEAVELLTQALAMRQQLYPKDKYPQGHPQLAQSLSNLGALLQARGDYAKALPYLNQ